MDNNNRNDLSLTDKTIKKYGESRSFKKKSKMKRKKERNDTHTVQEKEELRLNDRRTENKSIIHISD